MMKNSIKDLVYTGKNSSKIPPLWLMRQAGRYLPEYREIRGGCANFLDLCYCPEKAIEVTLQPIKRFDFDAAIIFSDILVIPDALGQNVRFVEKEGPVLDAIQDWKKFIQKGNAQDLSKHLKPVMEIVKGVRGNLSEEKMLYGFSGAPWTIASYMIEQGKTRDFEKIRQFSQKDSGLFAELLDLLVKKISWYLIQQIENGADIVQIFDSWASFAPKEQQEKFIINPIQRIVSQINQACPDIPIMYFGKGISHLYKDLAKGVRNLHFSYDQDLSPDDILKNRPEGTVVQGNLDPLTLVDGGEGLTNAIDGILKGFKGIPHIFNLGHGILPQTPVEHVYQLCDLVRRTS